MSNEIRNQVKALNEEDMELVSGGCQIVGGKMVSTAGCRCGSAPEEMTFNSVSYDPDINMTRCRFICSRCGNPLNFYRTGDRTEEFRPFIGG